MSEEQEAYDVWLAMQDIQKMAQGYENAVDLLQRRDEEIERLRQQRALMLAELVALRDEFKSIAELLNISGQPIEVRASAFEKLVVEIDEVLDDTKEIDEND